MLTDEFLEAAVQETWGISPRLRRLPGERDSNYLAETVGGSRYLLKISSPEDDLDAIQLQTELLVFLSTSPRPFAYPVPKATVTGQMVARWDTAEGDIRYVRLFDYVEGDLLGSLSRHSEALCSSLGSQIACLDLALAEFEHPAAKRYLKWDLAQAGWIAEALDALANPTERSIVAAWVDIFEQEVRPKWPRLRQQIIHGDLNDYNLVATDQGMGRLTGIIDFGDVVYSAAIAELAIALSYIMMNKVCPMSTAMLVIKAYQALRPLDALELDCLFDLICIRLCVSVVNSAIRKKENPHDPYLSISEKPAWDLLNKLQLIPRQDAIDFFRRSLQPAERQRPQDSISSLRARYLSPNLSLSYDQPLHIVRGLGQYLYDAAGRQYLDGVNNIAHVGHCHPRVVRAGQEQMALLNTNTRYLHDLLGLYAQKLVSLFPAPLEVCFLVSSGSEANELAIRLARTYTRRQQILVLDQAYHGNTSLLIDLSPYKFKGPGGQGQADYVKLLPLPDPLRQQHLVFSDPGIDEQIAAFMVESWPSCAGQVELPPGYLQAAFAAVRDQGGLCIADEIQVGFGRLGSHYWGFETQGVIPDIVTLGKPIGNGHPMGAVITTRPIAEAFCNGMEFFSSFGGNPVSCAIGLAVLEVLEEEQLQAHAAAIGRYLKAGLTELASCFPVLGDVRGRGLFLGLELVRDRERLDPDADLAHRLANNLRSRGILLSTDGPHHNVIKFKPPMVFSMADADYLLNQIESVL